MKTLLRAIKNHRIGLIQTRQERRHGLASSATLWNMKRDFQILFLKRMGLTPDHYLLDLGCWTRRGMIPFFLQKIPDRVVENPEYKDGRLNTDNNLSDLIFGNYTSCWIFTFLPSRHFKTNIIYS